MWKVSIGFDYWRRTGENCRRVDWIGYCCLGVWKRWFLRLLEKRGRHLVVHLKVGFVDLSWIGFVHWTMIWMYLPPDVVVNCSDHRLTRW